MSSYETVMNVVLLVTCYAYIFLVIFVSGRLERSTRLSSKTSRKFLHMMIGNLPFIIPFFSYNSFPVNFPFFVAAPFIIVSLLASSHSPSKRIYEKMKGLSVLTGGGHQLGLVFYAISYTVLAFFFSAKPYFIAAGILPMAYGDASAALIGEKYGKRRYHVFATKSVEGSIAMFLASFLSLAVSLAFFSMLYPLPLFNSILAALAVALVAVFAETLSPLGLDNLTVPLLSSLTFLVLMGGI